MAANLEEVGTDRCFRFSDGTWPVCGAKDQLGHLCHPCLHQDQMAEALLANETPRARQILLRRENHNLRMVRTFTTLEHQAVAGTTQAWRIAVAAKEAERDMLLERRRQNEERHE